MKFKEIKPGMVIHCPKEEDARALQEHLKNSGYEHECIIPYPSVRRYCHIRSEKYFQWHEIWVAMKNDGIERIEFPDLIEPEPEPRFKVGDKVKIKRNLIAGKTYGGMLFWGGTEKYKDVVLMIDEVSEGRFYIRETKRYWADEMLEPVENSTGGETSTDTSTRPLDTSTEMSAEDVLEWIEKNCDDSDLMQSIFGDGCENCDDMFGMYPPKEILKRIAAYEAAKKAPKPVEVEEGFYCKIYTENETVAEFTDWGIAKSLARERAREIAKKYAEEWGEPTFADVHFACRVKGE